MSWIEPAISWLEMPKPRIESAISWLQTMPWVEPAMSWINRRNRG
ncbi:hypothetical protein [Lysinibacillus sp. BPa_S21]|nr:hypothetical protein [Lysinibacillus sp. BPa_S21]